MLRGYTPDGQGTGGYSVSGGVALSTLVTGLVAYWSLDETSGTRADSVGTATLSNNNTVGYDTGVNGNAASFVAANSESLSADDTAELRVSGDKTFAFWVKPSGSTGYRTIVDKDGYWVYQNPTSNTFDIVLYDSLGAGGGTASTTDSIASGEWGLLLLWYTSSDKKLRASINNGTPVATPAASNAISANANTFYIGQGRTSSYYNNGLIDELAIWSRVLTSDERAELYNSGTGKFYNGTNFV